MYRLPYSYYVKRIDLSRMSTKYETNLLENIHHFL